MDLAALVGLPDEEELLVAGGGELELVLPGGFAEGCADIFLGVGEFGERDSRSQSER